MPLPTTRFAAQGATSATHAAASSRQGRSAASKGTLGSPGVRAPGPASSSPFVYCPRPRRVALTSAFSLRKRGSWGKHSFPHALRRGRDLNPRRTFQHVRDFQSRSLGHSDTSPCCEAEKEGFEPSMEAFTPITP